MLFRSPRTGLPPGANDTGARGAAFLAVLARGARRLAAGPRPCGAGGTATRASARANLGGRAIHGSSSGLARRPVIGCSSTSQDGNDRGGAPRRNRGSLQKATSLKLFLRLVGRTPLTYCHVARLPPSMQPCKMAPQEIHPLFPFRVLQFDRYYLPANLR